MRFQNTVALLKKIWQTPYDLLRIDNFHMTLCRITHCRDFFNNHWYFSINGRDTSCWLHKQLLFAIMRWGGVEGWERTFLVRFAKATAKENSRIVDSGAIGDGAQGTDSTKAFSDLSQSYRRRNSSKQMYEIVSNNFYNHCSSPAEGGMRISLRVTKSNILTGTEYFPDVGRQKKLIYYQQ